MTKKQFRSFAVLLPACLFALAVAPVSEAAVSKTSKRIMRPSSAVTAVVSNLRAAALSTTSIQWNWSTGTFSGIDGFHIYLSTQAGVLISSASLTAGTSFYVDSGLGVNKVYTRWITAYQGADEGSDSQHIEKYTFALPPESVEVPVSSVNATNAYVTWHFSTATAYAIEVSSDGGLNYLRNRESFVPWQTIQLLSNTVYKVRLGAVNGDDELTPNTYSAVKTVTTFPFDPELVGVAVSSYAIKWQWSTGTFTGTGISGYRLYRSSGSEADIPPNFYENVELVKDIPGAATGSWTELFIDSDTAVANSRHARWLKAVGYEESVANDVVRKYTYAIAPATCTASYPQSYGPLHVYQNSIGLNWNVGWTSMTVTVNGIAASFAVEYSTTPVFALHPSSFIASGAPYTLNPMTENTKYDLRIGAINGDGEQTPVNADNPYSYSAVYRAITQPAPPSNFNCDPLTDTALHCYWSTTTTTVNPTYITGYGVGELKYDARLQTTYWDPNDYVPETGSDEYTLDYFLTNSSHTVTIYTFQVDPDFIPVHASDPAWHYNGFYESTYVSTAAATFATPPNDVVFDTVGAHAVGMWWKEPEVPATQYTVQRSTNTGERGPWVFVSNVTGSHYNDVGPSPAGLTSGTTYSYRIGAINLLGRPTIGLAANTDGNRRDYSFVESTVTKHIAPTLYAVATGTRSIAWYWTDTVPGVTSYNLYTDTGGIVAAGLSASTTFYSETGLAGANTRYTRQVRSVAADGEGDYSEASASTLANPPAAAVVTSSGIHSLTLGWTANGSARYRLDRSTDGITWTGLKAWNDVFAATSFADVRLRFGSAYYYALRGYNDDGIVSVSSSVTAAATLPLPSGYTVVYATSGVSATAPLPDPSLVQVAVGLPAGTPDGYLAISTSAAASPADIPKSSLDAAALKLKNVSLVPGSIVELHLYDVYGASSALTAPARITMTYKDADGDYIVDATTPPAQANTLNLFNLDTAALAWNPLSSVVNTGLNGVYTDVAHFSFYALGSVGSSASAFSAEALSPTSIQWNWPLVPGADGYHLYSSTASGYMVLPSSANFYIDSGLAVNKAYTRWLRSFTGATEGAESAHVRKFTYALPPDTITLSTVTAESVYVTWHFSSATAYAIECSTNGGADYVRNREAFVPWQTIPLLSNKNYLIRMGAVNGDDELTPGTYSVIKTTITPPLTVTALSAVALSSFTIQWQWSTGTFTGTDISGYRLYHSTTSSDDVLPADDYAGEIVQTILAPGTTFWTETFVDGSTTAVAANSRHTRWIKAVGNIPDPFNGNLYLESQKKPIFQKYTYAIAPATTTVVYPDPAPWWVAHVWYDQVKLIWVPRLADTEASKYLVEYSTLAGFAVAVSTELAAGNPDTVTGLTENTKYDFRIGAINGDNEQTPANGLNPFAYSQAYKLITSPRPPSAYACAAFTDTALHCTWSTAAYVNPGYIDGYFVGELHHRMVDGVDTLYWDPWETVDGADSHEYSLDYMLTNSTHTISIWVEQKDPDWVSGNYHYDHNEREYYYNNWGSNRLDTDGATFATPPNDVVFDTVGAHAVGMWWKEPVVPATRYFVARSTNIGEDGPWVFVSSVTGSHYNDIGTLPAGLTPSTTYSYRIGAINLLGQPTIGLSDNTGGMRRDYSFVSSTITRHTAPLFSGVPVGTTSITWSWSDTGGVSGVQSYNLYTSTDGLLRTFPATAAFWAETGLPGVNANYIRRIRSIASDGLGDVAEASTYTWTNAPTGLSTSAAGVHYLALGWAQNESSAYRIDRSTDGWNWTAVKNWSDVFVSTSFTDTGLHYATTYYYAVLGYNHGGIVSLSSATTLAMPGMTLDLPARFTPVFSTAAVTQSKTALLPGVGWITLEFPAGTAPVDGYISISTDAATNPVGVTVGNLNTAAGKLAPNRLLGGSMVELYYFDLYGSTITSAFSGPVKITITYPDVNGDDIVDGIAPQMSANTLKLFNLDTSGLVWNQDRNSLLDKTARSVSSNIFHFSFYALGSITSTVGTLTEMFAYPNPYRPGTSGEFGQSAFGDGIVFQSLPAGARIRIYSLSGAQVAELSDEDGDGRCLWNTRNQNGAKAASGVYLYIVTGPGGSARKTGKVAIIR